MPRPRPPYLHRYHTRHGKFYWYVRRPGGQRTRIRAEFGTPEFQDQYRAAINGAIIEKCPAQSKSQSGSLAWLWERYRETGGWTSLKHTTRRQRENIMAHVIAKSGHEPASAIRPGDVLAGRDARSTAPSQAKGFLVCMRSMFRWAVAAGHVKEDPTIGIKAFRKKRGAGFKVWTEDEVDRYQAHWPIGTKERVWIDVLLYTGLRRGDAVTIGRQHVRNGVATLRTEKGQGAVTVTLPILPILAATLAEGPCADLAFICGASGKPLTKESFGNAFKEACVAAGVDEAKKAAHGIRKVGATRAADNGATEKQINAIFGWTGSDMARLYTEAADRKRASMQAMGLMERQSVDAMCQPNSKVGTPGLKAE